MSAERDEIRRQLGPIGPAGKQTLTIIRHRPQQFETKPNESDYDPDAWIALEGVVAGWIRKEHDA